MRAARIVAPDRQVRYPTQDCTMYRLVLHLSLCTSTVMPEPDETTTCQQLTSCITGPYQPTHTEFIDSLAEHVVQYRIGPPLQRSLLMIFIQDQRERLRQQSSSGSGLVRVAIPSVHKGSGVAGAACCVNEDNRLRIKRCEVDSSIKV